MFWSIVDFSIIKGAGVSHLSNKRPPRIATCVSFVNEQVLDLFTRTAITNSDPVQSSQVEQMSIQYQSLEVISTHHDIESFARQGFCANASDDVPVEPDNVHLPSKLNDLGVTGLCRI